MIEPTYIEPFRPQYHFTPPVGWLNDPNGLLYYDGEYHLFYQYIPDTHEHEGPKHWGHAISTDLVHWQHLPPAIYPDHLGAIWSGSAVVDWHNSSGLQTGEDKVLVALFTQEGVGAQAQGLAYSNDRGRTWTMHPDNPVIPNPDITDFRDPKVFWHAPTERWVMILAAGDRAHIYNSSNLIEWESASEFGPQQGSRGGVWECPDLFELPVDGDPKTTKWVMLVSMGGSAPNGGTGTQYFVGDFDGRSFHNDHPAQLAHWLDYGRDNYATITFADVPAADGRRLGIGWMSNWLYGPLLPTEPWRSAMTLPRELRLTAVPGQPPQLVSLPVAELQQLRGTAIELENIRVEGSATFPEVNAALNGMFEILLDYELGDADEFGLVLHNDAGEETIIAYDAEGRRLAIDRQRSGRVDFHWNFAGYLDTAKWLARDNKVRLHLFVDWSSVEVFVDNGRLTLTEQIFPTVPYNQLTFYSKGGTARLTHCQVWPLHSIWQNTI